MNRKLDRSRRIEGWEPTREPKRAWIVGEGSEAELLGAALSGLGVEEVTILRRNPGPAPDPLTRLLRATCDDVVWKDAPLPGALALKTKARARKLDLLVDVDGRAGELVRAVREAGVVAYHGCAAGGRVTLGDPGTFPPSGRALPSVEASLLLAALVTHDLGLRIVAGQTALTPLPCEVDLERLWGVNLSPARLATPLRVLMLGAGGLATPTGLGLALRLASGSEVVVCDDDVVDPTSRNRGIIFASTDDGRPKAERLCVALGGLSPGVTWRPVRRRFPCDEVRALAPFDAVLALTDTYRSRFELDRARLAPLFCYAGADPYAASVAIFPRGGPTASTAMDLQALAERELGPAPCADAPPSIVSTNFAGAALLLAGLSRHVGGGPARAQLVEYSVRNPERCGAFPPF